MKSNNGSYLAFFWLTTHDFIEVNGTISTRSSGTFATSRTVHNHLFIDTEERSSVWSFLTSGSYDTLLEGMIEYLDLNDLARQVRDKLPLKDTAYGDLTRSMQVNVDVDLEDGTNLDAEFPSYDGFLRAFGALQSIQVGSRKDGKEPRNFSLSYEKKNQDADLSDVLSEERKQKRAERADTVSDGIKVYYTPPIDSIIEPGKTKVYNIKRNTL